ncbi:MAG: cytochrome c [Nitrospinae bacterium CG11_big_fil_rev_8_21_14_0_20_56_8]|nr:MAG: cytochrome c [Nitrospinae bacterium CG11_big_fil_rev_8_21_14_0_20_56_8]
MRVAKSVAVIVLFTVLGGSTTVSGFHPSVYSPRVPAEILDRVRDQDNPYPATPERIEEGKKIYFGKGLCVTCHSNSGKGVRIPGHSSRDFTDSQWQDARTDSELMWVLKNGSPGTGMPVRVGKVITEEEGWNVIHFIRTFKDK